MKFDDIENTHFFDRNNVGLIRKWWIDVDRVTFLLVISLMVFGLMMAFTSSTAVADRIGVDTLFFLKKQSVFVIMGILIMITISFLEPNYIKLLGLLGIFAAVMLLFGVLIFGSEAKGAKRWISLFGFTLQPSEFAKTFFVVFNAFLLQKLNDRNWLIKYGWSAILCLFIASLLILQPDIGMTLTLVALWLSQLFVYGLHLGFIIFVAIVGCAGLIIAYIKFPHVTDRINRFLSDGTNYQAERSMDAYINGGFFGQGAGNGIVKSYIPDAHTDFIFAVIGEEFGLIFCFVLIAILIITAYRILKKVSKQDDVFSRLALIGLIMQFILQIIVNIGVSISLLPTKGMTLPFISYGGSSLLAMSLCFGIILALTKKKYGSKINYDNVTLY